MSILSKRVSISVLLNNIKEYWFFITVVISLMGTIFYMIVFQVTPLDKYYEIKHRREQVEFHNLIGYSLLERGHYELARTEFERAINLTSTDYDSLNGQYLSELFLAMETPDWNPAIGITIQNSVEELGIIEGKKLQHIVEKYFGDLNKYIGNYQDAKLHYEKALALKPTYIDALYTYGWFSYSIIPDLKKMELLFSKMVEADIYDFRGFHGYGYALYMQAINEKDPQHRNELMANAYKQSYRASQLKINLLHVVIDLGEIVRTTDPRLAIYFHERCLELLDDLAIRRLPSNANTLGVRLLTRNGYVKLKTLTDKRAIINYQLALDYLSLYNRDKSPEHLKLHDDFLAAAKALDKKGNIVAIFEDQLKIIDLLSPGD